MKARAISAAIAMFAGGCSFGFFSDISDLEDQIFVDVSEAPSGLPSGEYPVALVWADGNGGGVKVISIGDRQVTATANVYAENGALTQRDNVIPDIDEFGVAHPAVVGDPGADKLIVVGLRGNDTIATTFDASEARNGDDGIRAEFLFGLTDHLGTPSAVAFGDTGLSPGTVDLVVGGGNGLLTVIEDYANDATATPATCDVTIDALSLVVADVGLTAGSEILVGASGKVSVISTDNFVIPAPCTIDTNLLPAIAAPSGATNFGRQMLITNIDGSGGDNDIVVAATGAVHVYLNYDGSDVTDPSFSIDAPSEAGDDFGEQVVAGDFNGDGSTELAISDPVATAAGASGAGIVFLYEVSGSGEGDPIVLHAFEPASDQRFGGSLVSAEFGSGGGQDLLAVGTNGELFMYFRQNLDGSSDPRVR